MKIKFNEKKPAKNKLPANNRPKVKVTIAKLNIPYVCSEKIIAG